MNKDKVLVAAKNVVNTWRGTKKVDDLIEAVERLEDVLWPKYMCQYVPPTGESVFSASFTNEDIPVGAVIDRVTSEDSRCCVVWHMPTGNPELPKKLDPWAGGHYNNDGAQDRDAINAIIDYLKAMEEK